MRRGVNKFGARRTFGPGGRLMDSQAEADRAQDLELLQSAGEIAELEYQPVVTLTAGIKYKPDFKYIERGRPVFEDVKGCISRDAALKFRLWKQYGPALLRLTRRASRRSGFTVFREIMPTGGED